MHLFMRNYFHDYFLRLSKTGAGLVFASVTCRYGGFIIYCLVGPEEDIVQIIFAPEKHEGLQKTDKAIEQKPSNNKVAATGFSIQYYV